MTVGGATPFQVTAEHASPAPQQLAKRLLDLTVALPCLILLSPVLLVVALLVRSTSRGTAFFRQERIGRDGQPFALYKFRTMFTDCSDAVHREYVRKLLTEDDPPPGGEKGLFKLEQDPRITGIGRLLRRTSIDELPQLFNVVLGQMSLVGPRPALPWEAELIEPAYHARFQVAPGITGLWQVSGRNHLTLRQGLALDVEYVERQSLGLDLTILLKTVPVVLTTRGAL